MNDDQRSNSVLDLLKQAMEGKSFPTLESAQQFADAFMQQKNARPNDDFCGFSPDQMNRVLYRPFDSPDIVAMQRRIPLQVCTESPLLSLFLMLIDAIGEKGLKPTAKGNLPPALCRELSDVYWEKFAHTEEFRFGSIRTETDFFELHVVRLVGELAGFIRRYKGRIIVSQKCRKLMAKNGGDELYFALFECFVRKFNWSYSDGYPDLPFVQHSFLFTLYLLTQYGGQPRPASFYEDAYLRAFPMVLHEMPAPGVYESDPEERLRRLYSLRCLRRFAVFTGLADIQFVKSSDRPYISTFTITGTPLLAAFMTFQDLYDAID